MDEKLGYLYNDIYTFVNADKDASYCNRLCQNIAGMNCSQTSYNSINYYVCAPSVKL